MSDDHLLAIPPCLTEDIPGVGGSIKTAPEDFEVEEIPAYEPSGSGDFLYLWIEKRDWGAEFLVRQLARRLGIGERDIGVAGLKDRRAVTRQWVSVPAAVEERLVGAEGEGLRILKVTRHTNKLKAGHVRGNRFRIRIRETQRTEATEAQVDKIATRIRSLGLPNFYGPQRFGRGAETAKWGLTLLRGREDLLFREARREIRRPFLRRFAISAAQAALFNRYLAQRMERGGYRRVWPGDVMSKWPRGGLFVAEDVANEQQRFDRRETVTTGPIFGRKTKAAAGEAGAFEAEVLAEAGVTTGAFAQFGKLAQGTRRHNLVYIDDLHYQWEGSTLELSFTLPSGSYATVLVREFTKRPWLEDTE